MARVSFFAKYLYDNSNDIIRLESKELLDIHLHYLAKNISTEKRFEIFKVVRGLETDLRPNGIYDFSIKIELVVKNNFNTNAPEIKRFFAGVNNDDLRNEKLSVSDLEKIFDDIEYKIGQGTNLDLRTLHNSLPSLLVFKEYK